MPIAFCPTCPGIKNGAPGAPCPIDGTPLETIGTLVISGNTARLDGILLARQAPDPFAEAVAYLTSEGFQSGRLIQVAGSQRPYRGENVIFIESVRESMLQAAH